MDSLTELRIIKMSGAGNTFALIDARNGSDWNVFEKKYVSSRSEFAKKICSSVLGIGADGLLLIQNGSSGFDYDWDFYNSDGSTAEMCGNAARCAARYCSESLQTNILSEIRFKTGAGMVTTKNLGAQSVRVQMPPARVLQPEIELRTKSSSLEKFALVNTGVPHLVQKIHDMNDVTFLKEMAREVRSHHDLQPSGANVTFFVETSPGAIQAVTYERGVEDYTLACGTGAVAAAMVYSQYSKLANVDVKMPGGILNVQFGKQDEHPVMSGEALFIGEFKYNLEVMK